MTAPAPDGARDFHITDGGVIARVTDPALTEAEVRSYFSVAHFMLRVSPALPKSITVILPPQIPAATEKQYSQALAEVFDIGADDVIGARDVIRDGDLAVQKAKRGHPKHERPLRLSDIAGDFCVALTDRATGERHVIGADIQPHATDVKVTPEWIGYVVGYVWAQARALELYTEHDLPGGVTGAAAVTWSEVTRDHAGLKPARAYAADYPTWQVRRDLGTLSVANLRAFSEAWRAGARRACDELVREDTRHRGLVYLSKSSKSGPSGRCVRAAVDLRRGQLIERVPVVLIRNTDIRGDVARDYPFQWTPGVSALALGMGMMFNHAYDPNARYFMEYERMTMRFVARRPIKRGEEIFVSYNAYPEDKTPVWFDVK